MGFSPMRSLWVAIGGGVGVPVVQAFRAHLYQEPAGLDGVLLCPLDSDTLDCLPACEGSSVPGAEGDATACAPTAATAKSATPQEKPPNYIRVDTRVRREATLLHWNGRTGNNLNAAIKTLYVAHIYNCSWAAFPEPPAPTSRMEFGIMSLPRSIPVHLGSTALSALIPGRPLEARLPMMTRAVARALAEHYLRPFFTEATNTSCRHVRADVRDEKTLVVHLRSGDSLEVIDVRVPTAYLAPCAFANKIMAARGYERAVLVTEPDLKHPCISLIHKVSRVQSSSVHEDACTLMSARNLALMSRSTFSDSIQAFNPHLEEYHLPAPPGFRGCAPPQGGAAKLFYYSIHGWSRFSTVEQKMDYIARANESSVAFLAECSQASEENLHT